MQKTTKRFVAFAIVGAIGLCSGCGHDDESEGSGADGSGGAEATGGDTGDPNGTAGSGNTGAAGGEGGQFQCPGTLCGPTMGACFSCAESITGIPFVNGALSVTDAAGSTAALRKENGAACLSGTVLASDLPFAAVALTLAEHQPEPAPEFVCGEGMALEVGYVSTPLDAVALGIEQVQVTIDSPPSSGVTIGFAGLIEDDPGNTHSCQVYRSSFWIQDGAVALVTETETVTVNLSDVVFAEVQAVPAGEFDPSQITSMRFTAIAPGDFDFCVRDLRFFDANGDEVVP